MLRMKHEMAHSSLHVDSPAIVRPTNSIDEDEEQLADALANQDMVGLPRFTATCS